MSCSAALSPTGYLRVLFGPFLLPSTRADSTVVLIDGCFHRCLAAAGRTSVFLPFDGDDALEEAALLADLSADLSADFSAGLSADLSAGL